MPVAKRKLQGYDWQYVGIDGEGIGRKPHKYVLLTATTDIGQSWSLEDLKGLRTENILEWILETLHKCRVFSYSFGYDITCILKDLPNQTLYYLLRPGRRYRLGRLRPVRWHGFRINWLQGTLAIRKGKRQVVIWDIFKFFQSPFVKAIQNWGIETEGIEHMKNRRNRFSAREIIKIREYCKTECRQIAQLARKLIETHKQVGLTLQNYYGAGSTAGVILSKMKVTEYRKDPPAAMKVPIACAFFGGRFEHSLIGPVTPVYGYDISSAYPYQLYQLPCLKHGRWKKVTTRISKALETCTTALVHYTYKAPSKAMWAAFPHRSDRGSICYPNSTEGWAWLPEIVAAQKLGAVTPIEAWVYNTDCDCRPFADIPIYYRRRAELGKDTAGIIMKLGPNGCAGKLMQSKGAPGKPPKFQCWIWAGLLTSGTRAQILDLIAQDTEAIIGIATDGVYSRRRLKCPKPIDTGTFDLPKPLGGWEEKYYPKGMLFIKPGIYLDLGGDTVRARGVGRRAMLASKEQLLEAWESDKKEVIIKVDRFHGAKTSINHKLRRSPRFAQWSKMPIHVKFSCPNRAPDMGLLTTAEPSAPYSAVNPEVILMMKQEAIAYEQP